MKTYFFLDNGKFINIQRWFLWTLQPYDFDIHNDYNQSTYNKKTIREVLKRKLMIHKTSEVYKRTPIIN
jgi:hypothetical protein